MADSDQDPPSSDAPPERDDPGQGPSPDEPDEATMTGPPPEMGSDAIHEVTTAAPEEGSAEGSPAEAAAAPPAHRGVRTRPDVPRQAASDEEPNPIRVPKHQGEPRPVVAYRMHCGPHLAGLELVEEPEAPAPLESAQGLLAAAEERLFLGDLEGARAVAEPLAPPDAPRDGGQAASGDAEITPEQAGALGLLARAALMGGELDEARALLERHRDRPDLALADAALSLALGQLERAEKRMATALGRRPQGLAEAYTRALVQVAKGEMDEARRLLEHVSRSSPRHAVARHQLGQLVLASGDPARAGTLFEMAIVLAPAFVPPALALAEMLADSRQYGEAMHLLSELCDQHPGLLAPRLVQLRILLAVGDAETAITLAEALRNAANGVPDVELLWAEAMARRGDLGKASEALKGLLGGGVQVREKALRLLAQIELSRTPPAFADAVAHLDDALRGAPNSPELLLEVAQVHLQASDMTSARERLEKLAGLSNVDLGVLLSASVAAQNHGLFRTAIDLAEAALGQVRGTAAEGQISAFIAQLQGA